MTSVFTSYKKTRGFKLFGNLWEPIHELNLFHGDLRYDESVLIRKIMHIGHRLSQPNCDADDKEGYMLILKDLHRRIAEKTKEREDLEVEIGLAFDELVERTQFKLNSIKYFHLYTLLFIKGLMLTEP